MNTLQRLGILAAAAGALAAGVVPSAGAQTPGAPAASAAPAAAGGWQARPPFLHAHPGCRGGPRWRGRLSSRPAVRAGLAGVLLSRVRDLDLSVRERAEVRDLVARALRQRRAAGRPRYGLAVLGNPGSPQYAQAVRDLQARAAARISAESALATRIYGLLTARQRHELATLLAADSIRMRHFRERMARLRRRVRAERPQASPASCGPSSSAS